MKLAKSFDFYCMAGTHGFRTINYIPGEHSPETAGILV